MPITIDGVARTMVVNVVEIDVRKDIYSVWKNWARQGNNLKYAQAMRPVGGDPIGSGIGSPNFFFLMNNWKVVVDGVLTTFRYNLYCEAATNDNTLPFLYLNNGHTTNETSSSPVITISTGSGLDNDQNRKLDSMFLSLLGRRKQDPTSGEIVVYEADQTSERHKLQAYSNGSPSALSDADEIKPEVI